MTARGSVYDEKIVIPQVRDGTPARVWRKNRHNAGQRRRTGTRMTKKSSYRRSEAARRHAYDEKFVITQVRDGTPARVWRKIRHTAGQRRHTGTRMTKKSSYRKVHLN